MAADPIEQTIGRFGRYQALILFLITVGRMPIEYQLANVVFLLPTVQFVCLDGGRNVTDHCPCAEPLLLQSGAGAGAGSSVSSEWALVCDRLPLASLAQSSLQVGILLGGLLFGYISDRHGRKVSVVLAQSVSVVTVALSALSPTLAVFACLRLAAGVAVGGTMLSAYVLVVELSGASFRPLLVCLIDCSYVVGYLTLAGIGYFIRDWRSLQLATSLPWFFVVSYYWVLPESPRWLVTVGRKDEAVNVLKYIAKKNKLPTEGIERVVATMERLGARGSYAALARAPRLRTRVLGVAAVWLCVALVYFGVSQRVGLLAGDLYVNVALSAASLFPGLVLSSAAARFFETRSCVISAYLIVAVSQVTFTFLEELPTARLACALVGVSAAFGGFSLLYLYTSEVFPTVVRNSSFGVTSMFARLGGFVAPFVVNIRAEWISLLVFSGFAVVASVLCCFFPKTKGIVLSNTISDIENEGKHKEGDLFDGNLKDVKH